MIRQIKKTDKEQIRAIAVSVGSFYKNEIECCLEMADEAINPAAAEEETEEEADRAEAQSSYRSTTFACYEEGGKVVGFISYGPDEMTKGTWEVYWLAVHKRQQGKGIGRELMQHAEKEALKAKARQLVLETSSLQNYDHVRRFYEKLGYVTVATVPDYFAIGDHKVVYVKRLD